MHRETVDVKLMSILDGVWKASEALRLLPTPKSVIAPWAVESPATPSAVVVATTAASALSSPPFELFAAVTIAFFHGWSAAIASAGRKRRKAQEAPRGRRTRSHAPPARRERRQLFELGRRARRRVGPVRPADGLVAPWFRLRRRGRVVLLLAALGDGLDEGRIRLRRRRRRGLVVVVRG